MAKRTESSWVQRNKKRQETKHRRSAVILRSLVLVSVGKENFSSKTETTATTTDVYKQMHTRPDGSCWFGRIQADLIRYRGVLKYSRWLRSTGPRATAFPRCNVCLSPSSAPGWGTAAATGPAGVRVRGRTGTDSKGRRTPGPTSWWTAPRMRTCSTGKTPR